MGHEQLRALVRASEKSARASAKHDSARAACADLRTLNHRLERENANLRKRVAELEVGRTGESIGAAITTFPDGSILLRRCCVGYTRSMSLTHAEALRIASKVITAEAERAGAST